MPWRARRRTIYINGKFASQRVTGVQRFAIEIVRALDRECAFVAEYRVEVLTPPSAVDLGLVNIVQRRVGFDARPLHLWEQIALPFAARGGFLVSLTGSAPFLPLRRLSSILDSAIYEWPEAYTRIFVAWYKLVFAYQARTARAIITLTAFTHERLTSFVGGLCKVAVVGAAADHFAAVPADPSLVAALGLTAGKFLLAVGSANPTKNFARLIEAFVGLPNDFTYKLVIVGGRNTSVFGEASAEVADPRVVHAGFVADAALKGLYLAARAFVFPSLYEGFGLPPLEAMQCGCPVLAACAASLPEVCGDAALYFDPLDIAAMRAAMVAICDDDRLHRQLQAAGPVQAARFSWARSAAILVATLRDVAV